MNCPICISPLLGKPITDDDVANLKPLRCGHFCHSDCVDEWFTVSKGSQCPLCRRVHKQLTETSYHFLSLAICDAIRFSLVVFMAYGYYQTYSLDRLYIYIIVDCLTIAQISWMVKSKTDTTVFMKYLSLPSLEGLIMIVDCVHMISFFAVFIIHILQLRIRIPSMEFILSLFIIASSFCMTSCCFYYSIDK